MRQVSLEDGRRLCYALMTAHRRTPCRLTGASWRVAGLLLEFAKLGRDTATIDEISKILEVTHKVSRLALDRICAAEIVTINNKPNRVLSFQINWPLLDAVTEEGDREMAEYWRQRELEDDLADDAGNIREEAD
jgi:hypothetical protein